MGKHSVERPRHSVEVQRADEQGPGLDLAAAVCAEKAPELLFVFPSSPGRLLLEGTEESKLALRLYDPFHSGNPKRADQFVLEVGNADVEAESFHVDAVEFGAEAGSLQASLKLLLSVSL